MLLFILLLYIIIYAEGKCAKNYYYDGLLEECQHCSIRCNSPPIICKTFCTSMPENEVEQNQNIRLILIVFFAFLGAFTALTIILRVIRRKTCKPIINKVIGQEKKTGSERGSNVTEQSEDTDEATTDLPDGLNQHHYNSNLPLPSTEEGTTLLVTTKTVQAYHCTPVI
ncbi:tumor necrosis factor receptor superfamily member 17 [Carassius auratus]|uniref:Tumor necrosis factor receptor superfamily member 17 n=1 Tax=Carassius auratus TaxID=7957 RepID=A0A6P6QIQ9_CARAU|nr:tumor necrosis factor receptor superfamily member 17 [Carassius auratus]XP_052427537.1 tumor necrosis factor receptor superfamily member 17 [Carassius gibelio]